MKWVTSSIITNAIYNVVTYTITFVTSETSIEICRQFHSMKIGGKFWFVEKKYDKLMKKKIMIWYSNSHQKLWKQINFFKISPFLSETSKEFNICVIYKTMFPRRINLTWKTFTHFRNYRFIKILTLAGLEPAIPWFVVRCLIRWATGPKLREDNTSWDIRAYALAI